MTTTRRDILKGISGAALAAAAQPMVAWADTKKVDTAVGAPPLPTYVIVNGSFGVIFTSSEIQAFAPQVDGHVYQLDATDIRKTYGTNSGTPVELSVQIPGSTGTVPPISSYPDIANLVFRPDEQHFKYNSTITPSVRVHLPYPTKIYPHRLLGLGVHTPAGNRSLPHDAAGAVVLEYPAGNPPTIKIGSVTYMPICCQNYYRFVIAAGNPDIITYTPEQHAEMAWNGLRRHFNDMNWDYWFSGDPAKPAPAGPGGITDNDIEGLYPSPELMELLRKAHVDLTNRGLVDIFMRPANCKSPLFVAQSA